MRRLIEADLGRIVEKKLPWILFVLSWIYLGVSLFLGVDDADSTTGINYVFLESVQEGYAVVSMVIGFGALLGIYADEFKSMVMIGVIGRGISRKKFVLAKFLDLVILTFMMQLMTAIYVFTLRLCFEVPLNGTETKFLVLMFALDFIETISYVTVAAIFYYLSENAAVGMFAYLSFELIIPVILVLFSLFGNLEQYHLDMYYIPGLISSAGSNFILGDVAGAMVILLAEIAVYVVAALVITILIFRRKELEF